MPAPPNLIFGLSKPVGISEDTWVKWYSTERLPQLLTRGIATRAVLYREIPFPYLPDEINEREHTFLVLVQTHLSKGHDSAAITNLPVTSTLFEQDGAVGDLSKVHNGEVRDYSLVQDFTRCAGDENVPARQLITIEMDPEDPVDFDAWYREEHIPLFSKTPGFNRTMRYSWQVKDGFRATEQPAPQLAIHEVEDVAKALFSDEAQIANNTEWSDKNVKASRKTIARAWKGVGFVNSENFLYL